MNTNSIVATSRKSASKAQRDSFDHTTNQANIVIQNRQLSIGSCLEDVKYSLEMDDEFCSNNPDWPKEIELVAELVCSDCLEKECEC